MPISDLHWRLRRLIVAIVALIVLTVSFDVHPNFQVVPEDTALEMSHTQDGGGEGESKLSYQGVHHDHHPEIATVAGVDFASSPIRHPWVLDSGGDGNLPNTLHRPPRAALC